MFSGMWADNDSDDERPGFGKSNRRNKDMTAPIGFVSGGFKEGDKITKNERDADNTVNLNKSSTIEISEKITTKY